MASEHSEQQKTRLEEEVKELMKKVQEMEGVRHKKDLDATSKASELEGKVRFLSYFLFFFFSLLCYFMYYKLLVLHVVHVRFDQLLRSLKKHSQGILSYFDHRQSYR